MKRVAFAERRKVRALCAASGGGLQQIEECRVLSGYRLYLNLELLLKRQTLFCTFLEADAEWNGIVKVAVVEIINEDNELINRCMKEMQGEGISTMNTEVGILHTRGGDLKDCFEIEEGNYDDAIEMIYSNYTLHCLGIHQLRLLTQRPNESVLQKFLYTCKIDNVKSKTSISVLNQFAITIQGIISVFGFLDSRLVDGLLCPVTLSALNAFGAKFDPSKSGSGVVISESSNLLEMITPLVLEFRKTMEKLRLMKWKTSGNLDISIPSTFRRTFFKIQKMCGISKTGILDSRTLAEIDKAYDLLPKSRKIFNDDLSLEVGEQIAKCIFEYASPPCSGIMNMRSEEYTNYWKCLVDRNSTSWGAGKLSDPSHSNSNSPTKQNISMKPMSRLVERLKLESKVNQKRIRFPRGIKAAPSSFVTATNSDNVKSTSSFTADGSSQGKQIQDQSAPCYSTSPLATEKSFFQPGAAPAYSEAMAEKGSSGIKGSRRELSLSRGVDHTWPLKILNISRKVPPPLNPSSSLQCGYPPWIASPRVNYSSRMLPLISTSNIDLDVSDSDSTSSTESMLHTTSESGFSFGKSSILKSSFYASAAESLQKLELLKAHCDILTSVSNAVKSESTLYSKRTFKPSISCEAVTSLGEKVGNLSKKVNDLESDLQRSKFVFSMCLDGVSELKTQLENFELRTSKAFKKISG